MRNHVKQKYINARKEMKAELRPMLQNNVALQLLIRDTFLLYKARHLEHEVWYIIGTKYPDIYKKEFCVKDGLVGKSMCGRFDEFFNTMYFIDEAFTKKYRELLPDRIALGDAYAIVKSIWRKK